MVDPVYQRRRANEQRGFPLTWVGLGGNEPCGHTLTLAVLGWWCGDRLLLVG